MGNKKVIKMEDLDWDFSDNTEMWISSKEEDFKVALYKCDLEGTLKTVGNLMLHVLDNVYVVLTKTVAREMLQAWEENNNGE